MAVEENGKERHYKRVFINHIDTYSPKYIGKFLSSCVVGASLEEAGESELEEGEERRSQDSSEKFREGTFEVVGTVSDQLMQSKSTFITEEYFNFSREQLLSRLMECDVVIYNITGPIDQIDEASWAVSALHAELDNFSGPKIFILLSTVLTWAMSKPADTDDPELAFTEDDYRRRRAHPNFRDHISTEKLVVKMGKTKKSRFSTYVVASGLQYGMGEDVFHYFFKVSWLGEVSRVPVFGPGTNILPTIHVNDLAGVVQNIIDHKPKTHYLVAVDDSKNSFEHIIKAISSILGPGKIKRVPKEEAFLIQDFMQKDLDALSVNLRIETVILKENFNLHWVSKLGIVENITNIVEEYKQIRGLLPVHVCILGPPVVGKSTVAEKICREYKLHHIKLKDVISETIEQLENEVRMEDEESDNEDSLAQNREFLHAMKENMTQNDGRLDDHFVVQMVRDKLRSRPCQNQGFVLDGFPKTYRQAMELFSSDEEVPVDSKAKMPPFNKNIMPDYVFSLEASDEFLISRVMNLPESVVQGTHYAHERFLQHLAAYRERNVEDETVLNYFDELEIHPEHIEINGSSDVEYTPVMERSRVTLGKPRNYGPGAEELKLQEQRAAEEQLRRLEAQDAERQQKEAEEAAIREACWKEWSARLEEVKQQEQEMLQMQSVPLRNYLMKNVMPTLTQGLIDCCKLRPEDPVDFLAEYLFRNNPQIE